MEPITTTTIIILGCLAYQLFLRWKNFHAPPCISSWIPWFGAGFQFGEAPLEFIEKARMKYGPIFTIFAMGSRMTFVTEEEGINVFLKSKELNFEQAVKSSVEYTASIPSNIFFKFHEKLYVVLKGKLGNLAIHQLTSILTEEIQEHLNNLGTHGTSDLNKLVRHQLYPVTVNIIFKRGLFPTNEKDIREFQQHFQTYDEGFESGSQIPEYFLRNWSRSKKWFLAFFEKNILDIKKYRSGENHSMTVMQALLDMIMTEKSEQIYHSYGLMLLWASLSNAIPIVFWTLAFVLSHPNIHKIIMETISSVLGTPGKDKIKISEDDLKKLYLIKWCVLEAIRLRAPGVITRKVMKPIKILNYIVPAGDLLMLSPFWMHRNPKYFPEPEMFKPERWKEANLEKHAFLDGFLAFGTGKYQCPGRWFALSEVQIFIILMLYKYDCSLLDPMPKESYNHLIGVQQPAGPCRIEFKERK